MTGQPVLLVVDDEPAILHLVERVVRAEGFTTILHSNPREALERLQLERPDVALVDVQMPEIGGLDVLRAIKRELPGCAVILMSGFTSAETAMEAIKLGALECVAKPLDINRLRQRLADAARRLQLCGLLGRAEQMLTSAGWPGNVRELRSVLEEACRLADGQTLTERDLEIARPPAVALPPDDLEAVEREHIVKVLAELRGNKAAAAKRLGISRRTLYRRLERHGVMGSGGRRGQI
jgi:DNA-binding NtrC family response regulator